MFLKVRLYQVRLRLCQARLNLCLFKVRLCLARLAFILQVQIMFFTLRLFFYAQIMSTRLRIYVLYVQVMFFNVRFLRFLRLGYVLYAQVILLRLGYTFYAQVLFFKVRLCPVRNRLCFYAQVMLCQAYIVPYLSDKRGQHQHRAVAPQHVPNRPDLVPPHPRDPLKHVPAGLRRCFKIHAT